MYLVNELVSRAPSHRICGRTLFFSWLLFLLSCPVTLPGCSALARGSGAKTGGIPIDPAKAEALSCEGKPSCVVAYFSPTCPVCRRSHKLLEEIAEILSVEPQLGLRIIIGGDYPAALRRLGETIPFPTELDTTGRIAKSLHLEGYPTWAVLDDSNTMVGKTTGGAPARSYNKTRVACTILTERLGIQLQVSDRCS